MAKVADIVILGLEDSGRYICKAFKKDGSKFTLKVSVMALTPSPLSIIMTLIWLEVSP